MRGGEGFDPKLAVEQEYIKFPKKDFISYKNSKIL
jgi:hypothetical protein